MKQSPASAIWVPAALAVLGLGATVWWITTGSVASLQARVPGLDRPAGAGLSQAMRDASVGRLVQGEGKPADLPGLWPWFRGKDLDNVAKDKVALARQWPSGGPKVLWSVELGEGHAGPAVQEGKVYLLDYDRVESADALRCLSLADGKEIWRYSYPVDVKRNHGMSRTVPAVAGGCVVALGPKCHVTCLDAATGQRRWMIDLVRQYGTVIPPWYAGQCPLVDGDRVILAPCGKDALLVALDLQTGKPIWKTPNPRAWKMTHASIMPMQFAGRRSYVYCGSGGVVGIDAQSGAILWDTTEWKISIATVPSPVCLSDGRIFLCGGYNAGAMMLQLVQEGDRIVPKTRFRVKARQFGSTQQTPILLGEYLYGVREDKELVCLDLQGKVVWHSGAEHRFGIGPYLAAEGILYVLSDDGVLTMAEATPAGYKPLARAQVLSGHDAWGPMALVAGRLLARDLTRMVCLDVTKP